MYYEIVELPGSGEKCKIYSIIPIGQTTSLLEEFIIRNISLYPEAVNEIRHLVIQIAENFGAREHFFRRDEGKPGDGVTALRDSEQILRLYCIRYGKGVLILGDGGHKPKRAISWQDDPELKKIASQLIDYAADINRRIIDKDLYWSKDGNELLGNLKNYGDEEC